MTSPEGDKGWLFGTTHSLPEGVEWRTPTFETAFAISRVTVVELTSQELDIAGEIFVQLDDTPALPALLDRFEGGERQRVAQALAHSALADHSLDENESWAVALMLGAASREGDPENGVDRALMAMRPEVVALESALGQLRMFDTLPEAEQRDLIVAVAEGVLADQSEQNVLAWLTGDIAAFERMADTGLLADPELRDVLQTRRNREWLPVIVDTIDAGDVPFVAVGAAHMIGPEGLPALLEAEGYTVTRIQ